MLKLKNQVLPILFTCISFFFWYYHQLKNDEIWSENFEFYGADIFLFWFLGQFISIICWHSVIWLSSNKKKGYFIYLVSYIKAMIYCWFSVHFNISTAWRNVLKHHWPLIQDFLWPQSFSVDEGNAVGFGVTWLVGGRLSEVLRWLDKPLGELYQICDYATHILTKLILNKEYLERLAKC